MRQGERWRMKFLRVLLFIVEAFKSPVKVAILLSEIISAITFIVFTIHAAIKFLEAIWP